MDSEHATRRRLSECLGTHIHLSPIATLVFSSSSLINSMVAGFFTEWDGKDPAVLNEATGKLLGTLTTNQEPLFISTSGGELGFLLSKAALVMVKERDFYVAYALISAIRRSLQCIEQESNEALTHRGRIAYYRVIEAFLSAFCYLEMDEYAITPYPLRHLAQLHCLLASIHFADYLADRSIHLHELVQLLYVQLYLAVMFGHLDMLHECYIVTLYSYWLVVDLLVQLDLLSISTSHQSDTDNTKCKGIQIKCLHLRIGEDRSVFDSEAVTAMTALLDDIEETLQEQSHAEDEYSRKTVLLNQARKDFVERIRKLLDNYTPDCVTSAISMLDCSPKTKQLYNVYGKYGVIIAQLYIGITLLRNLVESSFGISTQLVNVALIDKPSSKMCDEAFNLTMFLLQASEEIPLHIGAACSLRPHQFLEQQITKPKIETIRAHLSTLNQCSKGLSKDLQAPPLLNASMIKSICAIMCSCLILLLVPTDTESTTIHLGSVADSLSMLSTHCTDDLLIIYTSLEILNAFVVSNCSLLLLHDISETIGTSDDFQSSTRNDIAILPMKRIASSLPNNKDAYLNKICEQVPKKSFCDDIDGWIEAIVDIIYTIPRQSISLTSEIVSVLQQLCRRESLTILRLLCANDDKRLQIIKYLRYLWFLAQSYRDKVLCMHHRLQGYSYAAHTLPLISNSFLQRAKSFFPLQNVLLDMYVISLEW